MLYLDTIYAIGLVIMLLIFLGICCCSNSPGEEEEPAAAAPQQAATTVVIQGQQPVQTQGVIMQPAMAQQYVPPQQQGYPHTTVISEDQLVHSPETADTREVRINSITLRQRGRPLNFNIVWEPETLAAGAVAARNQLATVSGRRWQRDVPMPEHSSSNEGEGNHGW